MAASPSVVGNPFRDSVLGDPWTDPVANVSQIGLEAFTLYRRELDAVRETGTSRSILFFGASGSGKTHLIGRVRRHLEERAKTGWLTSIFVAVRMQTPPARIWRHLRRRFVEDLLRRPLQGASQLDRLVFRNVAAAGSRGTYVDSWKAAVLGDQPVAKQDHLAKGLYTIVRRLEKTGSLQRLEGDIFDVLEGDEKLSFELKRVLQHFILGRHLGLVHGWLRGDSLAEADLATLGLKAAQDDEDPEGESRDLVLSLIRLTGRGTPVVFCFDQLEALLPKPNDVTGLHAFGTMASALHDETENSLLISCIMSDFVDQLKGVTGSNYARVAGVQRALPGVTYEQAERLIKARLALVPQQFTNVISMEDMKKLFTDKGEVTARKVLAHAAHLFDEQPIDQQPAVPAEGFLAQSWEDHLRHAESEDTLSTADQILEYGIPVLLRLDRDGATVAPGSRDMNFTVSSAGRAMGVSICNQRNMTTLAHRLRRIKASGPKELLLIRDPRLPIPKTARKTWEHLDELIFRGARFVRPSIEALAALDALRTLICEAQAGDLAHDGETISGSTVEEWLSLHLPSALGRLAQELMTGAAEKNVPLLESLIELIAASYLLPLDVAARKLACKEQELQAIAEASPASIGYLQGPPGLFFQPVSGGSA